MTFQEALKSYLEASLWAPPLKIFFDHGTGTNSLIIRSNGGSSIAPGTFRQPTYTLIGRHSDRALLREKMEGIYRALNLFGPLQLHASYRVARISCDLPEYVVTEIDKTVVYAMQITTANVGPLRF